MADSESDGDEDANFEEEADEDAHRTVDFN